MEGMCKEIIYYKNNKRIIKTDDLIYLKKKNVKIKSIVNIITHVKYRSIEDPPDNYKFIAPSDN